MDQNDMKLDVYSVFHLDIQSSRYLMLPYIQWDAAGSSFEEPVGTKMLGNITTENCCCGRDAPLQGWLPVQVAALWCMCMHCSPQLCEDLWKPWDFWPEIPSSVRRDSPPLIKARRGGLDSPDKFRVKRTHFCSKSWLVPRANLMWAVSRNLLIS